MDGLLMDGLLDHLHNDTAGGWAAGGCDDTHTHTHTHKHTCVAGAEPFDSAPVMKASVMKASVFGGHYDEQQPWKRSHRDDSDHQRTPYFVLYIFSRTDRQLRYIQPDGQTDRAGH